MLSPTNVYQMTRRVFIGQPHHRRRSFVNEGWQLFLKPADLHSTNIAFSVQSLENHGTAFALDQHYEGFYTAYFSFVQRPFANDPRSFLVYRASTKHPITERIMVAATTDGVNFHRPVSDISFKHDDHDMTANANVLFNDGLPAFAEHNFFIFKDDNPNSKIELRAIGGTDTTNMEEGGITRGVQGFHVLPPSDSRQKCLLEHRCKRSPGKYPKPDTSGLDVMVYEKGILGQWVMNTPSLFLSEDHNSNTIKTSVFDGQSSAAWDPIKQRYMLWVRTNIKRGKRGTHFAHSKDFKNWSKLSPVIYPHVNVSCYMINAVPLVETKYMVAFPQCYYERSDHKMYMVTSLVYSQDGGEKWDFVESFEKSFNWAKDLPESFPVILTGYHRSGSGPMASGMYSSTDRHYVYYHYSKEEVDGTGNVQRWGVRKHGFVAAEPKDKMEDGTLVLGPFSDDQLRNKKTMHINVVVKKNSWFEMHLMHNDLSVATFKITKPVDEVAYQVHLNIDKHAVFNEATGTSKSSLRSDKMSPIERWFEEGVVVQEKEEDDSSDDSTARNARTVRVRMHGEVKLYGYRFE